MRIAAFMAFGAGALLAAIHLLGKLSSPYTFTPKAEDAIAILLVAIAAALLARRSE